MSLAYARLFPMDNKEKQVCEMCGFAMSDSGEGAFDFECQCANQQSPEFYVYDDTEQIWADPKTTNFYVVRCGEMRYFLYHNEEQDGHEVIRYTSDLFENNIKTDEVFNELTDKGELYCVNNPWFEIRHDQDDSEDDTECYFSLDKAIAKAIELGKEKGFMV